MKIVLVSQRIDYIKDRTETRDNIDQNLINFINQAGFKAVTVPNVNVDQKEFLKFLVKKLNPHGIVLSGGNNIKISIGENCLIGANAGVGIPLGDNCTIEAGLYITAGTKIEVYNENGEVYGV